MLIVGKGRMPYALGAGRRGGFIASPAIYGVSPLGAEILVDPLLDMARGPPTGPTQVSPTGACRASPP